MVSLPLEYLYELIFDPPDNIPSHPYSRLASSDPWPWRSRREVGILLKEKDKDERYFHVEVFQSHAEIWRASDWKDSITRRILLKKAQEEAAKDTFRAQEQARKDYEIFRTIVGFLSTKMGINPDSGPAFKMARILADAYKSGHPAIDQVFGLREWMKKKYEDTSSEEG